MKQTFSAVALLAVASISLWAQIRQGPGLPPRPVKLIAGTGLIFGRVIDADDGSAIPDATARLSGSALGPPNAMFDDGTPGGARTIVSDAQGTLLFHSLPKGSYQIVVSAPGYINSAYGESRPPAAIGRVLDVDRSLDLGDGEKLADVVVRMWKQGSISGTVMDDGGEPIVGVRVSLIATVKTWGGVLVDRTSSALTDDRG